MTRLATLMARRDRARERADKAESDLILAQFAIRTWANKQIEAALAKRGITPGRSVVRMKVIEWSHGIACMAVVVAWTLFALSGGM